MSKLSHKALRRVQLTRLALNRCSLITARSKRYQAFDAQFDQEGLAEARSWYRDFDASHLPSGITTYARSSGPGGQHVNKTESKAMTAFPVEELISIMPKSLHSGVRASRYYTTKNDSLTFQAQTHRSRAANTDENRRKLMDEVSRIYREQVPTETSDEKKKKHKDIEKRFHEARVRQKKLASLKKQSRRGFLD